MNIAYKVLRDTWYYDWEMLVEAAPELRQYMEPQYNDTPTQEHTCLPDRHYNNNALRIDGLNEDELVLATTVSNDASNPQKIDFAEDSMNYQMKYQKFYTTFENDNLFMGVGDPGVPLLPLPKCFLNDHSKIWAGENTKYSFYSNHGHACNAVKAKFSHKGKFLRLIHASYYFDKKKNFMSEQREFFKCLSFNLETNKLYFTTYNKKPVLNKKNHKVNRYIKRLECRNATPAFLRNLPDSIRLISQFSKALLEDTKRMMPDVVIPHKYKPTNQGKSTSWTELDYLKYLICALVLQRRIGQPLPWAQNMHTLKIVYELWDIDGLYSVLMNRSGNVHNIIKLDAKKYRPKYMYKIHSNLKKKSTLKTFFTTILGHFTTKSIVKYLMLYATHSVPYNEISWAIMHPILSAVWVSSLLTRGALPTETAHLLKRVVDDVSSIQNARSVAASHGILASINTIYPAMSYDHIINNAHILFSSIGTIYSHDNLLIENREKRQLESFIKFLRRMWNRGELSANMRWTTWRDALNMADRLSLRIRPNKFRNFDDMQLLHDQLAVIQRRDISNKNELGHIYFLPCFCPQEEFDGFRFVQLTHVEDLIAEGTSMHHCVSNYGYDCATGSSIIFSMWKDRSYVTIELSGKSLKIRQQYTINDNIVTHPQILELIDKWHGRLLHMHRKDKETYADVALRFYKYQKMHESSNIFVHVNGIDISDIKLKQAELSKEFENLNVDGSGLYGDHKPTKALIRPGVVDIPETALPQMEAPRLPQPEEEADPFCEEFIQHLEEMRSSNGQA